MTLPDLHTRLGELADARPPAREDPALAVAQRIRRHRRRIRGATAVAVVVALVAATALWTSNRPTRSRHVTAGPEPATGSATAAQLARFHWSQLPPAPIEPRSDASVVWTGRELVVWGGEAAGSISPTANRPAIPKTDGAALDPATNRWRTIAPTPVAQRRMALTLWTGHEMLVIGGSTMTGEMPPDDAAYNPSTDQWRVLPQKPPVLIDILSGVWDGREALVLSSSRQMAAYDPTVNQWRPMPPWPEPPERQIWAIASVWTGDHLLAWTEWQSSDSAASPTGGPSEIDLWSIDPNAISPSWTKLASPAPDANLPPGASPAIWTGTEMLLPAITGGPPAMNLHGYRYGPATNAYRAIKHGPVDDASRDAVWTGGALVRTAQATIGSAETSRPPDGAFFEIVQPGDAAAWDPATNAWTVVPRAPVPGFERQLVWTGHEIISYGPDIGYRFGP